MYHSFFGGETFGMHPSVKVLFVLLLVEQNAYVYKILPSSMLLKKHLFARVHDGTCHCSHPITVGICITLRFVGGYVKVTKLGTFPNISLRIG